MYTAINCEGRLGAKRMCALWQGSWQVWRQHAERAVVGMATANHYHMHVAPHAAFCGRCIRRRQCSGGAPGNQLPPGGEARGLPPGWQN